MELNYYTLQLQKYLSDHRFEPKEIPGNFVSDRADIAMQSFEDYRRAGATEFGASEAAIHDMYAGVGSSRLEAACNLLEINFNDKMDLRDPKVLELWTRRIADEDAVWDGFFSEPGIGIDDTLIIERESVLCNRIDQFIKSYGIQQKTDSK